MLAWHAGRLTYVISQLQYTARVVVLEHYPAEHVVWKHELRPEVVRSVHPRLGLVRTDGGNTSSGNAGSQDNGGGSYPRWRRISDVHGFALVNFPNR